MTNSYNSVINFWDDIFIEEKEINPYIELKYEELERGLDWLISDSKLIIDFGCGNGSILLRCLAKGAEYVKGIDISKNGINLANLSVKRHNFTERADFICGDVEVLARIEKESFDGAILFNIIDNLKPEDGKKVLKEIHRVLKKDGKLLLKLNPYISKEDREKNGFKEISEEFYLEKTGLFLWNLSKEKLEELINPYFTIEKSVEVYFKEYNITNRMYYLRVKK